MNNPITSIANKLIFWFLEYKRTSMRFYLHLASTPHQPTFITITKASSHLNTVEPKLIINKKPTESKIHPEK